MIGNWRSISVHRSTFCMSNYQTHKLSFFARLNLLILPPSLPVEALSPQQVKSIGGRAPTIAPVGSSDIVVRRNYVCCLFQTFHTNFINNRCRKNIAYVSNTNSNQLLRTVSAKKSSLTCRHPVKCLLGFIRVELFTSSPIIVF